MKPRPRTASFYSLNAGGASGKRTKVASVFWEKWVVQSKVQGIESAFEVAIISPLDPIMSCGDRILQGVG